MRCLPAGYTGPLMTSAHKSRIRRSPSGAWQSGPRSSTWASWFGSCPTLRRTLGSYFGTLNLASGLSLRLGHGGRQGRLALSAQLPAPGRGRDPCLGAWLRRLVPAIVPAPSESGGRGTLGRGVGDRRLNALLVSPLQLAGPLIWTALRLLPLRVALWATPRGTAGLGMLPWTMGRPQVLVSYSPTLMQ